MDTQFDYFLLIAEEQNISRAARRAFVSQQSLSKYLQHLEERVGTPLFYRKPVFQLTPAGEIVLQRARQVKAITQSMEQEIQEISQNNVGTIRFGSSMGRALQLIPEIFPLFHERYPNVRLETYFGMTPDLCTRTINGRLDIFLGISLPETPSLHTIPLTDEEIYIAVSDGVLLRYFPDDFPSCKIRFAQGIDISEFSHVPFVINPQVSSMNRAISQLCQEKGITLHEIASINSNALQISLAAKDCAACFLPAFLFPLTVMLNSTNTAFQHLNVYPVKGIEHVNQVALHYRSDTKLPSYMNFFIKQIQSAFLEYPMDSFLGVDSKHVQNDYPRWRDIMNVD